MTESSHGFPNVLKGKREEERILLKQGLRKNGRTKYTGKNFA